MIIKPKEIKNTNSLKPDESSKNITNQDKENQEINFDENSSLTSKVQQNARKDGLQNKVSQSSSPLLTSKDDDNRRESWLHPRALEKLREQNRNEQGEFTPDNSLSELLPRASSTHAQIGKSQQQQQQQQKVIDHQELRRQSLSNSLQSSDVSHDNSLTNKSYDDNRNNESSIVNMEPHPTGIVLHRTG